MEDLKKFNEIFEDIKDTQHASVINELIQKINNLIQNEQENFISLCYWFRQLKRHFKTYHSSTYKYGAYENKNGRWYYERIIIDFGLSEKTVNKMISIANRFLEEKLDVEPKLRSAFLGYNRSKLFELLVLSDTQIDVAINTKRITPNMSVKQIREYVKSIKGGVNKDNVVLEEDDLQQSLDEQEAELPSAFDPQHEYDFEFYKSKTKGDLIGYCIDLQRTVQKLLRKKK